MMPSESSPSESLASEVLDASVNHSRKLGQGEAPDGQMKEHLPKAPGHLAISSNQVELVWKQVQPNREQNLQGLQKTS